MKNQYNSTLSKKRIIITTLIFLITPILYNLVNLWIDNETLAMMLSLNFSGWALIIYDWNLFGIHYNRAKADPKETLIYTIIGLVLMAIWTFINRKFLKGYMLLPQSETLVE